MSLQITPNFNMSELLSSGTAKRLHIDNTPNNAAKDNLIRLCKELLQPIRDAWGGPIAITSGYRCPELNKLVHGATNSSHTYGCAADITAKDKTKNKDLFNLICYMAQIGEIKARQIIWEKGTAYCPDWIHIDINSRYNSYKNNEILHVR